jgi:membrane fusion protein, multidrug efflux system
MFDQRDDRDRSGQTTLHAEWSDPRLTESARINRTNADTLAGPPASSRRGERPMAEPRERPASEPKDRPAPRREEHPAAEPRELPTSEPRPSEAQGKPREPEQAEGKKRKNWFRRHPIGAAFGALFLVLVGAIGYLYWDYSAHFESTDDAFIAARQFAIAPQVAGYVTAVPVTDNQHVDKGAVIAQIDPRDYRAALEQANAQVEGAQAGIKNIDAQIATQDAQIASNQAQVNQAQANLKLAQVTWDRDKPLVAKGWATAQQGTVDTQNLKAQQAAVESAQATFKVAQRQIETLRAQRASAVANLAAAEAQRDQAKLNLGYTTVTADQPGTVVNLTGAVGQYAQAGTDLTMFVPDQIWVVANFKETQLDRMRPGQPVDLEIDAYPERDFRGHVASVQPGSGPAFSLLPPENATGNFVKIVQRVPVKIIIDNPPTDVALGPGMSVVPTVRVDPSPSLYERLRADIAGWWRRV